MSQIIITGGNGGLARAIAARFADGGWQVDAPGRTALDVTDTASVKSYFATRTPDLLVCNAGVIRDKPLARLTNSDWQDVIDVNFHGARRCAAACLDAMAARGGGHVVFISSFSALHPPAGQSAYAAAKAALIGLAQGLATEVGAHGVRLNVVLPGFLETPMTHAVSAARRAEILASHTLGRFNTPQAVAAFLWHLHHDLPHTSGQVFQLDSRIA
jgi:3-oxoacyl-[acyl-carrier protein] reductase